MIPATSHLRKTVTRNRAEHSGACPSNRTEGARWFINGTAAGSKRMTPRCRVKPEQSPFQISVCIVEQGELGRYR